MSNILVIGGAGFIGSHLTEMLIGEGHNLVIVDNLFLGDVNNLKSVREKIKFYKHGYEDKDFLRDIIEKNNIEYVFNFGGYSSAPMFDDKEADGFNINVIGFINLMKTCAELGVKRVLYASSSSIYGGLDIQREDIKVFPPNFYSLTKYTMEHIARLFYDLYKIESIGFRFFSVYGKNEKHKRRYANLVTQFLWAIQDDKDVVIYGDGSQTRDFTYVKDICNALIRAMVTDSENAKANVYNVGTSETHTLNQMVDILEKITDKRAKRKYIKNPIKNIITK